MGMKEEVMGLAEEVEATVGGCVRCIADKPGGRCLSEDTFECSDAICREVAKRLRKIVEHDECEVTTVSAYDLLPEDEREAIAWVRDHGGLGAVEKRLMPAGMEWPKYTDGELVRIGGCWGEDGCDTSITYIERIIFAEDGVYLDNEYNEAFHRYGERVKRPPVLASDGEPLEAGQTVYDVEDGKTHHVTEVDAVSKRFRSMEQIDGSHWLDPMCFTHQRPVLDADGVPIHEGDTVYEVGENYPPFIVGGLPKPDAYRSVRVVYPSGAFTYLDPERLTHAKPEQDTWERIEEDATRMPGEYCERYGIYGDSFPQAEAMACDLVRRCRALAERGGR